MKNRGAYALLMSRGPSILPAEAFHEAKAPCSTAGSMSAEVDGRPSSILLNSSSKQARAASDLPVSSTFTCWIALVVA